MKKIIFALSLIAIAATTTVAQTRICYVDINKVLDKVPDYKTAQDQLDQAAEKWKQEVQTERNKIEDMYKRYQADEVLLDENSRKTRQAEIENKEKQVRDLQKQKFGADGQLAKKRQELVKPIQDKVYTAIEQYANEKGYDFIFDKSSTTGMLFANAKGDKTDDIIKKLGF